MSLSDFLSYQDISVGEATKAFIKSYWFVLGVIFGIIVYLLEQKYKK